MLTSHSGAPLEMWGGGDVGEVVLTLFSELEQTYSMSNLGMPQTILTVMQ